MMMWMAKVMGIKDLCLPWPCCRLFFHPPSYSSPVFHTYNITIIHCPLIVIQMRMIISDEENHLARALSAPIDPPGG